MRKILLALGLLVFLQQGGFSQQNNKPKLQAMYDAIKAEGIRHPDFVMAQCIQETGWLACRKCCLRYHNLFGFYIKGNKCKKFDSDEECIEYYKKWQDKRYEKWRKKYPKGDYYHFLKTVGYATGDKYTRELKPKVTWVQKNLKL
jgi:flagellum-specific peptidoglycan hydrolase FlgJ